MPRKSPKLPPVTIIIEWENAIDVEDLWTERALQGLARELGSVAPLLPEKPRLMYLYDRHSVPEGTVERAIARTAPELNEVAELEIVPTEGLTYYKLKSFGVARSSTDISVMLDSDAIPQPGWLEGLLEPFADPEIMVVAGFTYLAHDSLVSRAMALSWFFEIPGEEARTERRRALHANNFAVRSDFFRANPFPDLPLFKRQCVFWLKDIVARGHGFVRTSKARAVHAPHPGFRYLMWRGAQNGSDRDYEVFQERSRSRPLRVADALANLARKTGRSWWRIIKLGNRVDLPLWQRPAAMAVTLCYFGSVAGGQLGRALTKSYEPLPQDQPAPMSTRPA